MNRDISYRSPQQIPQSKKPNLENIPPQRNTFEYIKNMKKRQCDTPFSGISHHQDSQIQEARSIIIDISRIEQKSYYDQSLKGIQPSNCSTQRTNRYEIQRQSPYIEQQSFAGMYYMQQQMLQLQNENLELKQRLQQQENQRIMFQQITELKQQQQQQPIVINNNIMAQEKQNDCTLPIPMREQSHSIEKYKSPSIREPHQREHSKQINSYTNASVQFASPKICQQTQTVETEKSVTILPNKLIERCIRTDVDISQTNQDSIRPQYNILNTQSCKQIGETETSFNQSNQQISCNQNNKNSENQINQTNINNQSNLTQQQNQQEKTQTPIIPKQHSVINQTNQSAQQIDTNNQYSYTSQFRPSERLEVIFDDDDNDNTYDRNQVKKLSLADCFQQRKKPQDRKVSAPIPEEVNWIVNVKQRSKEDQMKLRKEMMSYGRSRKNTAATKSVMEEQCSSIKQRIQSPLMERLATGQKAKVEPKEMYALTKKNYENLPEVRSRKEQEEKKQKLLNFNKERQNKLKELDQVCVFKILFKKIKVKGKINVKQ